MTSVSSSVSLVLLASESYAKSFIISYLNKFDYISLVKCSHTGFYCKIIRYFLAPRV
jgi:hypothetical protein